VKRSIFILLIAIIAGASIFGACATPTPTPAPSPAPSPAPAPAPAPEVIVLRYNSLLPEAGWGASECMIPWLDEVEKATNDRVKFERYFAQTLSKGPDAWEATRSGLADISWCFHGFWAEMTPLMDAVSLPFLPFKSAKQASGIGWQLLQEFPSVADQFKDNKVLLFHTSSPYFIATSDKQVKTMADMKGLKIRVTGGPPTDAVKVLGASPIMVAQNDVYENLQKGVIDGVTNPWEAILGFRQYEVVKYYTYISLFITYFTVAVNWDVWNGLPVEVQQAIESKSGEWGSQYHGYNMFDRAEGEARSLIQQGGHEMIEYTLPPQEVEKWTAAAGQPIWDKWIKENEAKSSDTAKILSRTQELIKTYNP